MTQAETAHGRIGPNAIIRVIESLRARLDEAEIKGVLDHAGMPEVFETPPQEMVEERRVRALHRSVRATLGETEGAAVLRDAGRRTGDYLLAHRIPRPAQLVLKPMPAQIAARALIKAIKAHAWTFVGSGRFDATVGTSLEITIGDCPLCRDEADREESVTTVPICDFYTGTFQRIFEVLVSRRVQVRQTACAARGAEACHFSVTW